MQVETRREIVDRLLRFVSELNDPQARSIAEDVCAEAVHSIWLAHPFVEFVMPMPTTLTTVAGQALYVLPSYFGRIATRDGVVRNSTTGARIYPQSGVDLLSDHPAIGTALDTSRGDPSRYAFTGKVGLATQVATAGEALEVVSSSTTDAAVYFEMEGLDSAGAWQVVQHLLTGTSPVSFGTWTYVQTAAKSYKASSSPTTALTSSEGSVTVRKVGGGTRQVLLPHEAAREQYQVRFYPTPIAVQSILFPTIRLPRRLFQDADPIPSMWGPAVFERMLIDWRHNRGEIGVQAALELKVIGPEFQRLIGYDNELRGGNRAVKRAFGGMR